MEGASVNVWLDSSKCPNTSRALIDTISNPRETIETGKGGGKQGQDELISHDEGVNSFPF